MSPCLHLWCGTGEHSEGSTPIGAHVPREVRGFPSARIPHSAFSGIAGRGGWPPVVQNNKTLG